jgi:hypothetical protein
MTIPPRLKFMKIRMILMMKIKTKKKMIEPYNRVRIIKAEMTSCQRSLKTTKADASIEPDAT